MPRLPTDRFFRLQISRQALSPYALAGTQLPRKHIGPGQIKISLFQLWRHHIQGMRMPIVALFLGLVSSGHSATLDLTQSPDSIRKLPESAGVELIPGFAWNNEDRAIVDRAQNVIAAYARSRGAASLRLLLEDPSVQIHVIKTSIGIFSKLGFGRGNEDLRALSKDIGVNPDGSLKEAFVAIDSSRLSSLPKFLETWGHEVVGHMALRNPTIRNQAYDNREVAAFLESLALLEFAAQSPLLTPEERLLIRDEIPRQREALANLRTIQIPYLPGAVVVGNRNGVIRPVGFVDKSSQLPPFPRRGARVPPMIEFSDFQRVLVQQAIEILYEYVNVQPDLLARFRSMLASRGSIALIQGDPDRFLRELLGNASARLEASGSSVLAVSDNRNGELGSMVVVVDPKKLNSLPDALEAIGHAVLGHGFVAVDRSGGASSNPEAGAYAKSLAFLEYLVQNPSSVLTDEQRKNLQEINIPNEKKALNSSSQTEQSLWNYLAPMLGLVGFLISVFWYRNRRANGGDSGLTPPGGSRKERRNAARAKEKLEKKESRGYKLTGFLEVQNRFAFWHLLLTSIWNTGRGLYLSSSAHFHRAVASIFFIASFFSHVDRPPLVESMLTLQSA